MVLDLPVIVAVWLTMFADFNGDPDPVQLSAGVPVIDVIVTVEVPGPDVTTVKEKSLLLIDALALTICEAAIAGAAPTPITIGTAQADPATTFRRLSFEEESSLRSFKSVILVPFWQCETSRPTRSQRHKMRVRQQNYSGFTPPPFTNHRVRMRVVRDEAYGRIARAVSSVPRELT